MGSSRTYTTEHFIALARDKHGDTYIYTATVYVKSSLKLIIICKIHGEFLQTGSNHLQGHGCDKCARLKTKQRHLANRKTNEQFIEEANEIHGEGTYDYSLLEYEGSLSKLRIICPKEGHGEFIQTASDHLSGCGCPICGRYKNLDWKRGTTEQFIENARKVHGETFGYSKVIYVGCDDKVTITCPVIGHGDFQQTPYGHVNSGYGCSKCYGNYKQTTEEFIAYANEIHNNLYTYEKTVYDGRFVPITITCKIHGDFVKTPSDHVNGKCGCQQCVSRQYSKSSINWLDIVASYYNITIQHASNTGEYTIPNTRWKADGWCEEINTIYEFHGDYWHGNPKVYSESAHNTVVGKTYGELYRKTMERESVIRELGYNLVVVWEYDWQTFLKTIIAIQRKFRACHQKRGKA